MPGLIPRPFIDELLSRTDLVDLIDPHVPLKKRGTSYVACCPFHNEKTPSFNVNPSKQFYHCFGCGVSGNAISFAMSYLHLDFVAAIEYLANLHGLEIPKSVAPAKQQRSKKLKPILEDVTKLYQEHLKQSFDAIEYLKTRGITGEIARDYQLGYAKEGWHNLIQQFPHAHEELLETGMLIKNEKGNLYDRYRNRVMFPIHNRQGQVIGFGGRSIVAEDMPKYLNSPETPLFQKSKELYGLYQVLSRKEPISSLFVVEGYLDVIALAQHGINNTVATLGTATSGFHLQVLNKYCSNIIFCFDGDNAGRKAAWRALETSLPYLNQGLQVSFMFLPEGHDPDSLIRKIGQEEFLRLSKNVQSVEHFLLAHLTENLELRTLAQKNQLLRRALPYLQQIGPGPFLELFTQQLSRLTQLEVDRILQHIEMPEQALINPSGQKLTRTPKRVAIALLLQHPELYLHCHEQYPPHLFQNDTPPLISQLMELLIADSTQNTARLLEHWRDTPLFEPLSQLAIWPHLVPEEALITEFTDILQFLIKQHRENLIHDLLAKSRQEGLTKTDQELLQQLLIEKHQSEKYRVSPDS